MNAIIERVRRIFGNDVRDADERMQADSRRVSNYLIERAEFHIANARREVEDHLDIMIAERERQRQHNQLGPMTFEALPGPPAFEALAAPRNPAPAAEAQATLPSPGSVGDDEFPNEELEALATAGEAPGAGTASKRKKAPPRIR